MRLSQRLAALQNISPQVQRTFVPFNEWTPDLGVGGHNNLTVAQFVVPTENGYRSLPRPQVASDGLTARCQGLVSAQDASGNQYIFAGDATKLYSLTNQVWGDVSGTTYSTASDAQWGFAQFGQQVLATNYSDAVQEITLGGAAFADLITSTNKPKARCIAATRNFVILGNTNDTTDGAVPNRVWWSGIGDPTDFDPAASTQCGYQNIDPGGWVRAIVAFAEYAIIFMDTAIVRMTYEGPPTVFRFDVIDASQGTPYPGSVIQEGRFVYFINERGFQRTDGVNVQNIGQGKVNRYLLNEVEVPAAQTFDASFSHMFSTGIDAFHQVVAFGCPINSTTIILMLYHWPTGKWSQETVGGTHEFVGRAVTQGYTLDGLDSVGTDIDNSTAFPQSFDSRFWTGGLQRMVTVDRSTHKLHTFDDATTQAGSLTSSFRMYGDRRSRILSLRVITNADRSDFTPAATLVTATTLGDRSNSVSLTPRDSTLSYYPVSSSSNAIDNWFHSVGVVGSNTSATVVHDYYGILVEWVPTGSY